MKISELQLVMNPIRPMIPSVLGLFVFCVTGCYNNAHLRTQKVLEEGEKVTSGSVILAIGPDEYGEFDNTSVAGLGAEGSWLKRAGDVEMGPYGGLGVRGNDDPTVFIAGFDYKKYINPNKNTPWKLGAQTEINATLGKRSGTVFQVRPSLISTIKKGKPLYGGVHGLFAFGNLKDSVLWEYEVFATEMGTYDQYLPDEPYPIPYRYGEELQQPSAEQYDPETGEIIKDEFNVQYDPVTGELIQQEETVFDPLTGEPIQPEIQYDPITGETITSEYKKIASKRIFLGGELVDITLDDLTYIPKAKLVSIEGFRLYITYKTKRVGEVQVESIWYTSMIIDIAEIKSISAFGENKEGIIGGLKGGLIGCTVGYCAPLLLAIASESEYLFILSLLGAPIGAIMGWNRKYNHKAKEVHDLSGLTPIQKRDFILSLVENK